MQAAGKYRQQGKAYIVEDGDIILFKFNAGAGLTAGKDAKKKWFQPEPNKLFMYFYVEVWNTEWDMQL